MWENAGNEFKIIIAESFRKMLPQHGQNHFRWVLGMSSWWFHFFFWIFTPILGGKIPILMSIFFKLAVQPPTSCDFEAAKAKILLQASEEFGHQSQVVLCTLAATTLP